ncbi:MAG: trigger factor [Flavobacteriales bacterium]|nr:MAG: trigger factor [Flavobacteriales bacterium]
MNITKQKVDDLNAVIKVQLDQADYQEKVDKVLKDHRKNANIPGFRKGHVPMGMIKKQVGVSVMVDEINKVLSESLHKFITDEDLNLLGNPLPKLDDQEKIDWANQKDFEFNYEVGIAPEFNIDVVSKLKVDYYKIKVAEKDVDKYITDVAKRYGKMSNPDVAGADDMIFGKFEELDGTGNVKEGGINHSSVIIIEAVTDKKVQKSLVGAKANDTFDIDPKIVSVNVSDQAAAIGVDVATLSKIISKFKFTVEKINKIIPAEINQELFDKVYGPGVVSEVKEFRTMVSDELGKGLSTDADRKLKADIQDKLIEKLKLKLPDTFLKRWIKESNEKPITAEQVEEEYENYSKGLQWQLIENKLIQSNDIKVTPEEVVEHTKGLLAQQMAGMGLPGGTNDEELTETANRVLQNEEEAKNLYMMMYDMKLMDLYKSTLKLKEKEVTYEDFIKIAYDKK